MVVLGAVRGRSLQLDRDVPDLEPFVGDAADAVQHRLEVLAVIGVHDHMRGERFVSGGQRSDVDVVNDGHAG